MYCACNCCSLGGREGGHFKRGSNNPLKNCMLHLCSSSPFPDPCSLTNTHHILSLSLPPSVCVCVCLCVILKVYACGEGSSGKLGIGDYSDQPVPRVLSELSTYVVRKVATNSGARHALALTADGKVFSWGDGEFGQLGHGDNQCVQPYLYIHYVNALH